MTDNNASKLNSLFAKSKSKKGKLSTAPNTVPQSTASASCSSSAVKTNPTQTATPKDEETSKKFVQTKGTISTSLTSKSDNSDNVALNTASASSSGNASGNGSSSIGQQETHWVRKKKDKVKQSIGETGVRMNLQNERMFPSLGKESASQKQAQKNQIMTKNAWNGLEDDEEDEE